MKGQGSPYETSFSFSMSTKKYVLLQGREIDLVDAVTQTLDDYVNNLAQMGYIPTELDESILYTAIEEQRVGRKSLGLAICSLLVYANKNDKRTLRMFFESPKKLAKAINKGISNVFGHKNFNIDNNNLGAYLKDIVLLYN